jgi:hypothetical protein
MVCSGVGLGQLGRKELVDQLLPQLAQRYRGWGDLPHVLLIVVVPFHVGVIWG